MQFILAKCSGNDSSEPNVLMYSFDPILPDFGGFELIHHPKPYLEPMLLFVVFFKAIRYASMQINQG